jgi:hypothetical protein
MYITTHLTHLYIVITMVLDSNKKKKKILTKYV